MEFRDLTVEVRDRDINRLGVILPHELKMTLTGAFCNVGTWQLELPLEHHLTYALRTPGAGLVVTGPTDVLLSGPMVNSLDRASKADPGGSVVFEGVSDDIVLADYLCYPEPSNVDPAHQTRSHDVRTGDVESLLHAYVANNLGPLAPPLRRKPKLGMGANLQRGPATSKSARFDVVGTLLRELAPLGRLGFRVVDRGGVLRFETYQVQDRSRLIRLDVYNSTLASHTVSVSAPTATRVLVAGKGELEQRQFYSGTSAEAEVAEAAWGRRIERFVDKRQSENGTEQQAAAQEVLLKEGRTVVAAEAVGGDAPTMKFGTDWGVGDDVCVVINGTEATATVTGFVLSAGTEGVLVGAQLGDTSDFYPERSFSRRVETAEQRLSALERNLSA